MGTEMVLVNENWSMPECLKEMRQQAEELDEIYYVYVIDDDERLRGIFPLKKMITSPSVSKVKHVMQKDPISVHVDTPIDEVVQAIEKYDLVAIPVSTVSGDLWDKSPSTTSWMKFVNSRNVTTSWHPVFRRTWKQTIMY